MSSKIPSELPELPLLQPSRRKSVSGRHYHPHHHHGVSKRSKFSPPAEPEVTQVKEHQDSVPEQEQQQEQQEEYDPTTSWQCKPQKQSPVAVTPAISAPQPPSAPTSLSSPCTCDFASEYAKRIAWTHSLRLTDVVKRVRATVSPHDNTFEFAHFTSSSGEINKVLLKLTRHTDGTTVLFQIIAGVWTGNNGWFPNDSLRVMFTDGSCLEVVFAP